jgi:transcriptional activator of cad operon
MLRIGDWCVNPAASEISRDGETARVEVRTMRLLLCLAEHAGEVVSIDDLLNQVWPEVTVAPDSVYQAVTSLRRLLGDDPKQPTYIATVPRLGYRMMATVGSWAKQSEQPGQPSAYAGSSPALGTEDPSTAASVTVQAPIYGFRRRHGFTGSAFAWVGGATLCVILLALLVVFVVHGKAANGNPAALPAIAPASQASIESIAVLPFLDLTEGMKQEEFADGMTEELIGRFSKIPGLRVPSPTSSFYFKGKQIPLADIAKTLGVAYVLDGSVRKSGVRLRVAARLIRADNGYVVWSETYDRSLNDILMVQDDIAGEVTKALKASIDARPDHQAAIPH